MPDVLGLPLHPLVVHAAVVLVPMACAGLLVAVAVPKWRPTLAPLTLAVLYAGTVACFIARASGPSLATQVGVSARHMQLGDRMPFLALLLCLVATGWYVLARKRAPGGSGGAKSGGLPLTIASIVTVLLALATTVFVMLTGHSGAESVWG